MTKIIEQDEGLFTRRGATRALGVLGAVSLVFGYIAAPVLFAIILLRPALLESLLQPAIFPFVLMLCFAGSAPIVILQIWRRCDRCHKRLFSDDNVITSAPFEAIKETPRDYRAKAFMGSYLTAAVFTLAFKGRLRCQWCGHEDGERPDYSVKAN